MIPQHIIEKAIAGGWDDINSAFAMAKEVTEDEHAVKVGSWWYDYRQVALDPDFWMALGKECGWDDDEYQGREWREQAHFFYDLILRKASQKELQEFWNNL